MDALLLLLLLLILLLLLLLLLLISPPQQFPLTPLFPGRVFPSPQPHASATGHFAAARWVHISNWACNG
ncbi:hypothetical protein E2C01_068813 [Portunus trituberculatus]|uniref:Uncharacterized protein n=1 Tax=Portunus trituberculatus TaxID=210409 RepID=A0A5B7I149_PORTR|nr:hypothetical protein [Portunus trituberculatus]